MTNTAKHRSTMRMGSLNLLVLVIALCLVVLSVLALVSANMMASFTDRQDESTTQYYVQETAGQSFLVAVSDGWATMAGPNKSISQKALNDYMNYALTWANSNSSTVVVNGKAESANIQTLYETMGIPYDVRGKVSEADFSDSGDPAYCYSIAEALGKCETGVKAHFTTNAGQKLDALIGLTSDGRAVVLSWLSSREWQTEQEELLGSGMTIVEDDDGQKTLVLEETMSEDQISE